MMKVNKRIYYIIGAIFFGFFIGEDRKVLNFPLYIDIVLYFSSFLVTFGYFYFSNRKYKYFHLISELISSTIIAFIVFVVFKMGLLFVIEKMADKEFVITEIPISNFISGRSNVIYFHFENNRYSVGYQNEHHLERRDIIDNYNIQLSYSKSIFNTYIIRNYKVVPK